MPWEKVETAKLRGPYLHWMQKAPIINNRFIGFLGLAHPGSQNPGAEAWLLQDERRGPRSLLALTEDEVIPLHHPLFPLLPQVVHEIRASFCAGRSITLHGSQIDEWTLSLRSKGLEVPSMQGRERWLYSVERGQLRPEARLDFRCLRIQHLDEAVAHAMRQFSLETLGRQIVSGDEKKVFDRHTFYGLYQHEELLSLAAATRFSFKSRCLSYVYTAPAARGQGHAARLVSHVVESLLQDESLQQIFLYADASNESSQRLYEKLGFQKKCRSVSL